MKRPLSSNQADLLILSGRVSIKMAPVVRRIYDQMLEPKWAIAMGACSSSMGVFNNYAIVPGRQVHADRRPRPGLPAAARGADARHPQAAQDDPGRPRHAAGASATTPRAPRRPSRSPPVPDQVGLELIAGQLEEAIPGSVIADDVLPRARDASRSRPAAIRASWRRCASRPATAR